MFHELQLPTTCLLSGEKPYSCPYCSQKFTAPSSRATHIRSIHEKTQEYLCPQCDKSFNQKSNMIKHYKTIHLENVLIVCQECGREFNQASALRRHIKIVHKKETPHICQCGKRFALAESLKKHMEAIHLKSRAHPCTYCDYAASRADMLKIHIRKIHTKEWSYKCDICESKGTPWGCILPKELRRHLQTRHPEEYTQEQAVTETEKSINLDKRRTTRIQRQDSLSNTFGDSSGAGGSSKEESKSDDSSNVDEKAMSLLNEIKHPLEFSVQLEAEVRAKACRAPPSVLLKAEQKEDIETVVFEQIGSGGTWAAGGLVTPQATLYRQVGGVAGGGERWQVVSSGDIETEAAPVLIQRADGQHHPLIIMHSS